MQPVMELLWNYYLQCQHFKELWDKLEVEVKVSQVVPNIWKKVKLTKIVLKYFLSETIHGQENGSRGTHFAYYSALVEVSFQAITLIAIFWTIDRQLKGFGEIITFNWLLCLWLLSDYPSGHQLQKSSCFNESWLGKHFPNALVSHSSWYQSRNLNISSRKSISLHHTMVPV